MDKKQEVMIYCLQENHFCLKDIKGLTVKGQKKIFQVNKNKQKNAGVN